MKFLHNGPDIPFELIKALEEDKLIFFCGAGVSQLRNKREFSSFKNLLKKAAERLNYTDKTIFKLPVEIAFERLANKLGRTYVEDCIRQLLTLDEAYTGTLPQHEIILRLACSTERPLPRLVTTNFDNCFHRAWERSIPLACHSADALPVPDKSWSSIVHLHGKADILHSKLVYSITGFANAYIGYKWATNFLMELFREYTVVFLGYSMQDPIMRYGVHAQHPERQPYIFISQSGAKELSDLNLKIIPFEDFKGLWGTLRILADTHEQGREGWITYAKTELLNAFPTGQEMAPESAIAVKNLTEILSDPHKARALSGNLPIGWLDTFKKIDAEPEKWPYFNVLQPVNSNSSCSYGRIVNPFSDNRPLHPVTQAIGEWLVKNIGQPAVLAHIVENGSILHSDLVFRFKQALREQTTNGLMPSVHLQAWELLLYHTNPTPSRLEVMNSKKFEISEGSMQNNDIQFLIDQLRPRLSIKRTLTERTEANSINELLDINLQISSYSGNIVDLRETGLLNKLQNQAPNVLASMFDALEAHLQEVLRLSSLFQNEELLNYKQNLRAKLDTHGSDSWDILLNWFWAAFDALSETEKQRRIEHWTQSRSLFIRRISLQAFNRIAGALR